MNRVVVSFLVLAIVSSFAGCDRRRSSTGADLGASRDAAPSDGPRDDVENSRSDGSLPNLDASGDGSTTGDGGGAITQGVICETIFRSYCTTSIGCGASGTVNDCVTSFRSDCCGAGCGQLRPDVSAGDLGQCTGMFNACETLNTALDGAACSGIIWPAF